MKRIFLKMIIGVSVCLLSLGYSDRIIAAEPQYILQYAGTLPIKHNVSQSMYYFAKLVNEKTNGKAKVEVFPAGQLFSDKDMIKTIPEGALDMGSTNLAMWSGIVPAALASELILFFNDRAHHIRFEDSPGGEILKKEVETKGVKFINWLWTIGGGYFYTNKPFNKLDDIKGLRIRSHGEIESQAVKILGATPTFLGAAEVYMALQRGTIDGTIGGASHGVTRKYYEVAKYVTNVQGFQFVTQWVLMNRKKWDSLPADIQNGILEAGRETQKWNREEEAIDEIKACESLKKMGKEPSILPSPELEKMRNLVRSEGTNYLLKRAGDLGRQLIKEIENTR